MNPQDDLEEIECITAYDEAKASNEEAIPFDDAVAEIERQRPTRGNHAPERGV